jgi:hypothetical protein
MAGMARILTGMALVASGRDALERVVPLDSRWPHFETLTFVRQLAVVDR